MSLLSDIDRQKTKDKIIADKQSADSMQCHSTKISSSSRWCSSLKRLKAATSSTFISAELLSDYPVAERTTGGQLLRLHCIDEFMIRKIGKQTWELDCISQRQLFIVLQQISLICSSLQLGHDSQFGLPRDFECR